MHMWQVSAGQQGRPKVTGRRTQLLSQSARAEMRRAGSGKSEDSMSAAATDSEADSITTDGGSHKRKPGSKKGAHLYQTQQPSLSACLSSGEYNKIAVELHSAVPAQRAPTRPAAASYLIHTGHYMCS